MAPKKVVIFGVTGVQGGSAARALLADGKDKFDVWGVTRHKTSKKAQEMEKLGVTLIEGDLDNPSSYEEGLKGADNIFLNADFWIYYNGKNADEAGAREEKQNKDAIDAARRQGVPHIVFSALNDFGDKFPVPHCDSKVRVVKYLREIGQPHTLVYPVWYFSNVLLFDRKKEGDKYIVTFPFPDDHVMLGFASEQIGLWARLAFRDPAKWDGKEIHCDGEKITPLQMAKALSEATGKTIETAHMTREQFYSDEFKNSMPEELFRNYMALLDGEMKADVELAHKLVPEAYYFKDYVANTPAIKTTFV